MRSDWAIDLRRAVSGAVAVARSKCTVRHKAADAAVSQMIQRSQNPSLPTFRQKIRLMGLIVKHKIGTFISPLGGVKLTAIEFIAVQ